MIAAAVLLTDLGGDDDGGGQAEPASAVRRPSAARPAGRSEVQRRGLHRQGPGDHGLRRPARARPPTSATVGTTLVEVRYSKTCQAAWARITQAAPGRRGRVPRSAPSRPARRRRQRRVHPDGRGEGRGRGEGVRDAGVGPEGCTR